MFADDLTFFSDAIKLSEYVLNDSGCIFTGTDRQIGAIPWFYGQVREKVVLRNVISFLLAMTCLSIQCKKCEDKRLHCNFSIL